MNCEIAKNTFFLLTHTFPQEFIPERFDSENLKSRHPLAFQPFGFAGSFVLRAHVQRLAYTLTNTLTTGRRVCIGMQLSNAETHIILSAVIKNFRLSFHPSTPETITKVYGFATHPKEDIFIQAVPV